MSGTLTKGPVTRSQTERQQVMGRTGGKCYLCSDPIVGAVHIDHVLAFSADRSRNDRNKNLLATHPRCNLLKKARSLRQLVLDGDVVLRPEVALGERVLSELDADVVTALREAVALDARLRQSELPSLSLADRQRRKSLLALKNDERRTALLQRVRSPHVVQCVGVCAQRRDLLTVRVDYCVGDEDGEVVFRADLLESARQLACALRFIHQSEVAHLAIRPEHVLIESVGHVRLCGFGSARARGDAAEDVRQFGETLKSVCFNEPALRPSFVSLVHRCTGRRLRAGQARPSSAELVHLLTDLQQSRAQEAESEIARREEPRVVFVTRVQSTTKMHLLRGHCGAEQVLSDPARHLAAGRQKCRTCYTEACLLAEQTPPV